METAIRGKTLPKVDIRNQKVKRFLKDVRIEYNVIPYEGCFIFTFYRNTYKMSINTTFPCLIEKLMTERFKAGKKQGVRDSVNTLFEQYIK